MTIESAEEFVRLRSSEDMDEQHRASHEDASESVWLSVVRDHPDMRSWVAQNKTVPLAILRVLATDEDADVRGTVASKRKLDAALFELLAGDSDSAVRHRVACNAKVPRPVLEALADDPEPFVNDAARSRLDRA